MLYYLAEGEFSMAEKSQNIYDDPVFFEGYQALRAQPKNYNLLLEQPAMSDRLPDVKGKCVLDLGCGAGGNCLDFIQFGAKRVLGVDISEKMLAAAAKYAAEPGIEYRRMDIADVGLLKEQFDVVYSSLAFHYVKDFKRLITGIYDRLNPGGTLLFSQEHPIITATLNGEGHYNRDAAGKPVSYTFSNYNQPGKRVFSWFVDGVENYHRTLGEIITTVAKAGFVIEEVYETAPQPWAVEIYPKLDQEWLKPNFLLVKAKKP